MRMGLQIPQNIDAKKLINDASVLGIGVLSDSQEASIWSAERKIGDAQGKVRDANGKIDDANGKAKDANAKKSQADSETSKSEADKSSSPTESSMGEQGNSASSVSAKAKSNAQKMSQSQTQLQAKDNESKSRTDSAVANLEGTKSKIDELAQKNAQLSAENQALLDGVKGDVDASFDGTGSGTKSAYSLATATEAEEIARKNPEDPTQKASSNPNSAKFDSNVDQMNANEQQLNALDSQAQGQKAQADASASSEQAEADAQKAQAEQVKAEGEQSNSTIATIEGYAKDGIQVGNALDVSGSVLQATGVALTTAGTLTATAGAGTTATGIAVTSIGAGVTALGVPLCALFGIGVPIVGAGGTTTAGGGVTTATGGTITGIGGTLVTAGNGTQAIGKGLSVTGKGLKVAGNAVLTGTNIAKGDVAGAITSAVSTVATSAAFSKTAGLGSKAVSQKVYDIASAAKDGINSVKHFAKGEYAAGFVDAFSAASFGSGAVGDFTSGKTNQVAEVGNSLFAAMSSGTSAYENFSNGDVTSGVFDLAGTLTAGSSARDKVAGETYHAGKEDAFYCTINKVQSVYNRFFAPDSPKPQIEPEIAQNQNGNDYGQPVMGQNTLSTKVGDPTDITLSDDLICQADATKMNAPIDGVVDEQRTQKKKNV